MLAFKFEEKYIMFPHPSFSAGMMKCPLEMRALTEWGHSVLQEPGLELPLAIAHLFWGHTLPVATGSSSSGQPPRAVVLYLKPKGLHQGPLACDSSPEIFLAFSWLVLVLH